MDHNMYEDEETHTCSQKRWTITSDNYEEVIEECYASRDTPRSLYAAGYQCTLVLSTDLGDYGGWWAEDEVVSFIRQFGLYIESLELHSLRFDGFSDFVHLIGRFPVLKNLTLFECGWKQDDFHPQDSMVEVPRLEVLNVMLHDEADRTTDIAQWLVSGPGPDIAALQWELELGSNIEAHTRFFRLIGNCLESLNLHVSVLESNETAMDADRLPDLSQNIALESFCFGPLDNEGGTPCNFASAMMSRLNSPRLKDIIIQLEVHTIQQAVNLPVIDWPLFQTMVLDLKDEFPSLSSLVFEVKFRSQCLQLPRPIALVRHSINTKLRHLRASGVVIEVNRIDGEM